jgi:hypothetical protein
MFGSQKALLGLENKEISNKYGRSTRITHMQEEFVSSWIGMGIIGHRYEENYLRVDKMLLKEQQEVSTLNYPAFVFIY